MQKMVITAERFRTMVDDAEKYMRMALNLAKRGVGSVEPNPAVGAVITKANQIIGKGWHRKFGDPHAEINALEDCKSLGVNPRGATMYVTLEPCSHHGKTGPCTQAIINAGLAKVVVAVVDPSEHAGGRGINQLKNAGIEVQTGVCENEAKLLNAPFIKFASRGRSWVVLKWAQTIDGKVAGAEKNGEHKWISNTASRRDVHKLRRSSQAILIGINTVIADNPMLTARPSKGKKPMRIVLDSFLRIPTHCKLLKSAGQSPVIILTSYASAVEKPAVAQQIAEMGAELLVYPDTYGRSNLYFLLDELNKRGVTQLLVEGGPTVLTSFLRENLADEICIYITPKIYGGYGRAGISGSMDELTRVFGLHHVQMKQFGDNIRLTGLTEKALCELSISNL
ncbi:MAG: bifunctional diaminohydroxyphosphoribosylaminopyrimidine deaminase/5-amino-6-(5-phosphoribosylamino)uracil reductase RibD [Sedimentisphaerales bacterium]|nr:bifunctional diaminohydroxyphosphoribosylaminopyrimidine deaminase/5-amino-6-(5-phosphoribosylamino)uracil reductase RibD [Sedimentisphaerales bacterium]